MNALEQDFSGIGIPSFSDVFLGEKVPRFIVSQVNANKSVDLIGRVKSTNVIKFANNTCRFGSAIQGIERKISYSGKD